MSEWQPIETAPRDGTPVYVKSDGNLTWGSHLLAWNSRTQRWEGKVFLPLGPIVTFWDDSLDQPTHWKPCQPPEHS
jgi:hypothetical protein